MKDSFLALVRRFSRSRDFTISFCIHLLLILLFGTAVIIPSLPKQHEDMVGEIATRVAKSDPPVSIPPSAPVLDPSKLVPPSLPPLESIIRTPIISDPKLESPISIPPAMSPSEERHQPVVSNIPPNGISPEIIKTLQKTAEPWKVGGKTDHYKFSVFIGQYRDGNWNSTVRVQDGRVVGGSIPNLLYYLEKFSAGRINGNEQDVRIIKLDSPELLETSPPFVFLTGTQDFVLTDEEVANLRAYVRKGGAIWGDSSVPGLRSRFDIAFRREMRRVLPDKNIDFEKVSTQHPIFTRGYFSAVKDVVPGLNYYAESVYAMKLYGQIAILYTANDYADMWQLGLSQDEHSRKVAIDLRRDEKGQYVAVNPVILQNKDTYLHNLSPDSLEASYQFGANIIVHLLGRWDGIAQGQKL